MNKRILISIFCLVVSCTSFCQSTQQKKPAKFRIKRKFGITVAGKYYNNDTIPVSDLLKNPKLEIKGYKDSIQILSYEVVFNWRGKLSKYTIQGTTFSKQAIAGIEQFMVTTNITIQNIKCWTPKDLATVEEDIKLVVLVPHNYIVAGYANVNEADYSSPSFSTRPMLPTSTHMSKVGIIITGDTLTPKDTNHQSRYVRLSGSTGLGSIVINLDSIQTKDSIKHLPHLQIWGSYYPASKVSFFNLVLNMNTEYPSQKNYFTKKMVSVLSTCKPGTVVWITAVYYDYGFIMSQNQNIKFTVESFKQ
ncbi:MAG TPA: hypothetical protein VK806_13810 [Bacteroidia bacterium]|jgi:hypothetical protein|nr:hypothetical protein [Bacteroidia bacterium]